MRRLVTLQQQFLKSLFLMWLQVYCFKNDQQTYGTVSLPVTMVSNLKLPFIFKIILLFKILQPKIMKSGSYLFCDPSDQMVRFKWENIISLVRWTTEPV